jgi:hypothetical protein
MAAKKRTIVGSPLTPEMLDELGALSEMSPSPVLAAGAWTDTYRIFACHGYRESGNETVGALKIQRTPSQSGDTFVLNVTQRINNDAGIVHVLDAQITCQADRLATPIKWRTKSTFRDASGAVVRDLGTEQTGLVNSRAIEIHSNGKTRSIKTSGSFTGDWCLLEAVQRMPYTDAAPTTLDVLEEMDLLQTDQRMAYRGQDTVTVGGAAMVLHHFQQWGSGMLPYDYWLDPHHRLQIFVTLSIAYIRDDKPEQTTE